MTESAVPRGRMKFLFAIFSTALLLILPATVLASSEPAIGIESYVVDQAGNPIAGASVAASPFARNQRPAGAAIAQHLQSTGVRTAANGKFRINVPGDTLALIVQAARYAPAVVATKQLTDAASTIRLTPGASLRVRWDAASQGHGDTLSLVPVQIAIPEGLTRDECISLWTRRVSGTSHEWTSLPAGTYRVVLRSASSVASAAPPSDLGEVILAPGDDRTVTVLMPAATAPERNEKRASVSLLILDDSQPDGLVVTQWQEGLVETAATAASRNAAGLLLTAPLRCVTGSSVVVASSSLIGAGALSAPCDTTVRVPLGPRAALEGRVTAPKDHVLPNWGTVKVANCFGSAELTEFPFRISGGRFRVDVRSDCADRSLRIGGFSPVPLASQPARSSIDLGTVALRPGAAAAVRVRSGADGRPLPNVRIVAVRQSDLAKLANDVNVTPAALATVSTNSAGWARMAGLPEERIVFLLHAEGRRHPQVSEPYTFAAGEESLVDDLLLEPPASLVVTLDLPERLLGAITLDTLDLHATGHNHWPERVPLRGIVTAGGGAIHDIPPGTWKLTASGRLENGFALTVGETTVDVLPGSTQTIALAVADALYRCSLRRSGSPVSGVVNLTPSGGQAGRRTAVARADEDGHFQVLLEGPGRYSLSLQESDGSTVKLPDYVSFDDPASDVTIDLPSGRVSGRVVDAAGSPVEGMAIAATEQSVDAPKSAYARNGAEGTFSLGNLAPGRWEVVAESKSAKSEPVVITISEGHEQSGITLIVDSVGDVTVRIVDAAGGPIGAAMIVADVARRDAAASRSQVQRTAPDGSATFRLQSGEQSVPTSLVVLAPDGRITCALRRLNSDQTVTVPRQFGQLRIVRPRRVVPPEVAEWLLSAEGCAVPFFGNLATENSEQRTTVFPKLSPGTWTYVVTRGPAERAVVATGRGSSLPPIRAFEVVSGSSAEGVVP